MSISCYDVNGGGARTDTISFLVSCPSTYGILIAGISYQTSLNITSVKYNGVSLSLLQSANLAHSKSQIYYMLNPPSGSHTLEVIGDSTSYFLCVHGVSYDGVDDIDNGASNTGTSTSPTVSVSGISGEHWAVGVEGAYGSEAESITDCSGQTRRSLLTPDPYYRSVFSDDSDDGTVCWTLDPSQEWSAVGARLIAHAPKVYAKVSGVWKQVSPHAKVSGVWKKIEKVYVKVSGVWKEI